MVVIKITSKIFYVFINLTTKFCTTTQRLSYTDVVLFIDNSVHNFSIFFKFSIHINTLILYGLLCSKIRFGISVLIIIVCIIHFECVCVCVCACVCNKHYIITRITTTTTNLVFFFCVRTSLSHKYATP